MYIHIYCTIYSTIYNTQYNGAKFLHMKISYKSSYDIKQLYLPLTNISQQTIIVYFVFVLKVYIALYIVSCVMVYLRMELAEQ